MKKLNIDERTEGFCNNDPIWINGYISEWKLKKQLKKFSKQLIRDTLARVEMKKILHINAGRLLQNGYCAGCGNIMAECICREHNLAIDNLNKIINSILEEVK